MEFLKYHVSKTSISVFLICYTVEKKLCSGTNGLYHTISCVVLLFSLNFLGNKYCSSTRESKIDKLGSYRALLIGKFRFKKDYRIGSKLVYSGFCWHLSKHPNTTEKWKMEYDLVVCRHQVLLDLVDISIFLYSLV